MKGAKPPLACAGAGAAVALGCSRLRRPVLSWGATSAEAASILPGDELLEHADGVSTCSRTSVALRA
jgi:hypothetical protein